MEKEFNLSEKIIPPTVILRNGSQIRCLPVGDDGLGIRGFTANRIVLLCKRLAGDKFK